MAAIPGELDTDGGPPMAIPLRHFVVGFGFLLAGVGAGLLATLGVTPGLSRLAHVHLLLAGWVCITILGAMTQFVPVWSGVALHSRRLANVSLLLVTVGIAGMAGAFATTSFHWIHGFGGLAVVGFWLFAYNLGRTLLRARPLDVTERHFAWALGFFVAVTTLGFLLALDFTLPVTAELGVTRTGLRGAHVTLAVFGAVLTTVVGALYQLATMFTGTSLHGLDRPLQRVETVGYPVGVLALAAGRLVGARWLAQVGGLLVAVGLLAVAVVLARRLQETQHDWTPMLERYAVVAATLAVWAAFALPAWLVDPLSPAALFGAPGSVHLLTLGVVGFVVAGTLYHVVPFVVWVHRYSDRLGFEPVPMIDDLYDARVARADFLALLVGSGVLALGDAVALPVPVLALGGALATLGAVLFVANLLYTVHDHAPQPLAVVVLGSLATRGQWGDHSSPENDRAD
ncbi:hypothetical protein [Halorarius litoreus]|uniref:hypothetical protein n=1 Tax=Halorarius litoreus TaxID=2962676 RepID=UPI0020CF913C|nr:hypothetical protein [Halorarius litoreus]